MSDEETFQIRVITSMADIDRVIWDKLAVCDDQKTDQKTSNPFLTHAFLSSLEESGSANGETGWLGQHLLLENGSGEVLAAMPCYLKNHSQGEYVFDHNWAEAYHRAGVHYYPKLQCSVPFTPATGNRILTGNSPNKAIYQMALMNGLEQLARNIGASSAHITFMQKDEWKTAGDYGFLQRVDQQFHWENNNYKDFDDFLASLTSRKRKNIKKERAGAENIDGLSIEHLTGDTLSEEALNAFYDFYMDTGAKKWGRPYLTRKFYTLIKQRMADQILLIMAKRNGKYIAGAINFIGGDCLYGRHWGCIEDHRFLHFEICYYQAIEYAINNGIKHVEAGAQGEHKLARGYTPSTTYSAHYIAHSGLSDAIENYLVQERKHVSNENEYLTNHAPFKKLDATKKSNKGTSNE